MQPTVSVIIPAYNSEKYVAAAIESVAQQTYENFEIIVVDDGSTDGTWSVIDKLSKTTPRMRAIRAEHKGLAAARNRAIAEMTGDWIALQDADDLWKPDKLARSMEFLQNHPELSIVYTPMQPISEDGKPLDHRSKPCESGQLTRKLFHSIFVHDPATVFHKHVLETCGPFDESLQVSVGHEFWLRVSTKFEFGYIDEPLALRRCHETSVTRRDRSWSNKIKVGMIERFYFERGGKDLIPEPDAFPRLSKINYSAGKVLLKEGHFDEAKTYFEKALRYEPANLKARLLKTAAALRARFA